MAKRSPQSVIVAESRIAQISTGAGWLLFILGLLVLVGWKLHVTALTSVTAELATMKANTAVAFVLTGAALLRRRSWDMQFYSLGVLVIGAATLGEYFSASDFGIDRILFRDPDSVIDPGRMSQITSVGLSLLGAALLLMRMRSAWVRRLSRGLGWLVGSLGFVVVIGYSYDTQTLYRVAPYSSVALHTALAFVIAAIGIQCAYPLEGLVHRLIADNAGGAMLRRLFPAALLIPFLLGFTAWLGHKHLGWQLGFSMALVVAATTYCLLGIMLRNASHLEERDLAVRRSKEELGEAQRVARVGSWLWDADTGITQWSEELYRIHGLDPKLPPPTDRQLQEFFTPESWSRLKTAMGKAVQTGSVDDLELQLVRRDGAHRWVTARGEVVRDAANRIRYLRGTTQDVTEQKETSRKLQESQSQLAGIIASAMDAIVTVGDDHKILLFNAAAEKLFCCSAHDAIGHSVERFIPRLFCAERRSHIGHFGESGAATRALDETGTLFGVRTTGEEFSIEVSISHVEAEGKPFITAIIRDITERLRSEQAVRESEERFRLVANAAPVLIWMSGLDKLCNYFNQAWLEFTGRPFDAEVGKGWSEGVHPEDLESCLNTYAGAFDRRDPFRMEYRLRRNDGEYRWILDSGVPRFNQDGSFAGYIGSCVDVTEHKLAEEALSSANRKLIEAQEDERTRIARELHDDINQQLAVLVITLDRLKQGPPRSVARLRSHLEELRDRASDVSYAVQALSHRLHSSKLEYLGLVAAMQSFCREFSEQHQVDVNFAQQEVPGSLPRHISICLFRVLQAALANALKHSGVKHFEVLLYGTTTGIHLTVHDRGSGFDLQKVLKKHGIGLISMRERVRLVNGKISIQSKPNGGTTIDVEVPLETAQPKGLHRVA